uniref:Uncharacterized protein n=1 Tax=Arundo donax TaxID=35708 RepID=A0A0A8YX48_ARUDO
MGTRGWHGNIPVPLVCAAEFSTTRASAGRGP